LYQDTEPQNDLASFNDELESLPST